MSRSTLFTTLLLSLSMVPACSESDEGPATALAATKIDAVAAIKAARAAVDGGWPLEYELEIEEDKPVFQVDLWVDDGIETAVIDAVTGTLVRRETSEVSAKEKHALEVLDDLSSSKRMKLAKATKAAIAQFSDSQPFEADYKLREEKPIFVIQMLVGETEETIEIPVEIKDEEPAKADDSE